MTYAESSNERKDNIEIRWNPITQAPTPVARGKGYSLLQITKDDPTVICPNMPLYQTNSMHFMHASIITTTLISLPEAT